ncbi:MAG: hypothetical protein QW303_03100 [Nitrososphaerota archaeon]
MLTFAEKLIFSCTTNIHLLRINYNPKRMEGNIVVGLVNDERNSLSKSGEKNKTNSSPQNDKLPTEIVQLIEFRDEVSELVDVILKEFRDGSDPSKMEGKKRLLGQVVDYYNRLKVIQSCYQTDDEPEIISDEDLGDSDEDYTKFVKDRIYKEPNNYKKISECESELRKKLLGLTDDDIENITELDENELEVDTTSEGECEHILHNSKRVFKELDTDIILDASSVDYDEPQVKID